MRSIVLKHCSETPVLPVGVASCEREGLTNSNSDSGGLKSAAAERSGYGLKRKPGKVSPKPKPKPMSKNRQARNAQSSAAKSKAKAKSQPKTRSQTKPHSKDKSKSQPKSQPTGSSTCRSKDDVEKKLHSVLELNQDSSTHD